VCRVSALVLHCNQLDTAAVRLILKHIAWRRRSRYVSIAIARKIICTRLRALVNMFRGKAVSEERNVFDKRISVRRFHLSRKGPHLAAWYLRV
jgi:hypothetical protein